MFFFRSNLNQKRISVIKFDSFRDITQTAIFFLNRTLEMNSVMSLIRSNDLIFESSKKRKHTEVGVFSLRVDFTDKISNQLLKDIQILSDLKRYISRY